MPRKKAAGKAHKKLRKNQNFFHIFSIALAVSLLLDRAVKHVLLRNFFLGTSFPLLSGFLYFTFVGNSGAAFSIFPGMDALLICTSTLLLFLEVFLSWKNPSDLKLSIFSGLVAGGIASNIYDRIFYGFVIDFIDFRVWPVFNIADIFITIGAAGIAIILLRRKN